MRVLLVIFSLIFNCILLAGQADYTKADNFAKSYKTKTTDVQALATQLTSSFSGDLEKVRCIFIWIANNIQYDYKEYLRSSNGKTESYKIVAATEEELAKKKQKLEEERYKKSVKNTLAKRKGVCQNYAELFNEMCRGIHIKSGIITGSIKDITGRFIPNNHAWNWVEINGKTYLLDVTWASGHVDETKGKYTKDYNDGFFLAQPSMLIINHYPDDSKWQLLNNEISLQEFKEFPAVGPGFFKYKVKAFSPKISSLSLKKNQLPLEIKFGVVPKVVKISNNNNIIKEYNNIDNDNFTVSVDLKKNKGLIDIWGDKELILSYKIK